MQTQVQTRHGWLAPACRCDPHGFVHPQCCFGMREQGVMHKRCCGDEVVPPETAPIARVSPFEARRRAGLLPVTDITGSGQWSDR